MCGHDAPPMELGLPKANEMDVITEHFILPDHTLDVFERHGVVHDGRSVFSPTDGVTTGSRLGKLDPSAHTRQRMKVAASASAPAEPDWSSR